MKQRTRHASPVPIRHLIGLALAAGLILVGCRTADGTQIPVTPTVPPTAWPTLAPVSVSSTTAAAPTEATVEESGPRLDEKYRAQVLDGVVSVFPLEGRIDQPVRIEVIVLSGEVDPVITISNAVGDRLAFANTGDVGQPEVIGQFLFPGDGYYELGIASVSGSGEVGVSVYRLKPAELEGGGVFASADEELLGTIEHPASYHTFRLPLERGKRIDLAAEALTDGLDLLFELYGPDGVLLEARDDNVGADPYLWNFMPNQSGTYTVVLSNYDENTGDYALRVGPSEGGGEAVVGTRTSLDLEGAPRRSTWLTLDGRALDGIRVEARPVGVGVDITITVSDPYGNRLTGVNEFGPDEPEQMTLVQFPFDGEYQVEFLTLGESGEIDYYIRPIGQADIEMGGRVVPGAVGHEGEIVGPGTAVVYAFDGQAGDLLGIDAHATGDTGLDLGVDLYGPEGYLLVTRDDVVGKDPVIDRIELPVTGRYVLVVWNFGGTTGPFDLFVTRPEAPDALPGATLPPAVEEDD
jgi:hypothetical protein